MTERVPFMFLSLGKETQGEIRMKKSFFMIGLLLAAAMTIESQQAESVIQNNINQVKASLGDKLLTTADAVIARYLEAIGGHEAVAAIKTLMLKGRNVRFGQGDTALYRYYGHPNLFKQTRSSEDANFIVSDGLKTWSVSPAGRRELTEWWAISLKHFRIDGNFIDYENRGIKYDYMGLEGFATEPFVYYHLRRTFADGFIENLYFDVHTGLLHALWTTSSPIKESPQVFYDYRMVGGVLFPHAWMRVHDQAAPPHLFIVEEIKLNECFGPNFFKQTEN
jgi:hypothetical protein